MLQNLSSASLLVIRLFSGLGTPLNERSFRAAKAQTGDKDQVQDG
jgi:hypothetical protein